MLSQAYNIIIYHGISAPGHRREVVDGIDATYKIFFQMMSIVQLPGTNIFDAKMTMHSYTPTTDVSLSQ